MRARLITGESADHSVNWVQATQQSICAGYPDLGERCLQVVERLAALLLDRLPPELGRELYRLLPEGALSDPRELDTSSRSDEDRSIGYPDFLKCASLTLGQGAEVGRIRRLVDAFLWAVAHEIPPDLKNRMSEVLPAELRSRMNLYSAVSDDSRVA